MNARLGGILVLVFGIGLAVGYLAGHMVPPAAPPRAPAAEEAHETIGARLARECTSIVDTAGNFTYYPTNVADQIEKDSAAPAALSSSFPASPGISARSTSRRMRPTCGAPQSRRQSSRSAPIGFGSAS